MSLLDMWHMLLAGWRLVLLGLVAALVAAAGYLSTTPEQYEGTLLVRVGQVGAAGSVQQIEAASDAVERMQSPAFQEAVVESLGWKRDERERLFRNTFQATSSVSKHLKITLRAASPDDAKRAVEASLVVLSDMHEGMAESILAKRDRELVNVAADILDSEAFLRRMESLGKEIPSGDRQSVLLWLQAVKDEKSRLRLLRLRERAMKESMKPELGASTMAAEPAAISKYPVHPKARRVWVFAVVGGLLLGVFLVLMRVLTRENVRNCAGAA